MHNSTIAKDSKVMETKIIVEKTEASDNLKWDRVRMSRENV